MDQFLEGLKQKTASTIAWSSADILIEFMKFKKIHMWALRMYFALVSTLNCSNGFKHQQSIPWNLRHQLAQSLAPEHRRATSRGRQCHDLAVERRTLLILHCLQLMRHVKMPGVNVAIQSLCFQLATTQTSQVPRKIAPSAAEAQYSEIQFAVSAAGATQPPADQHHAHPQQWPRLGTQLWWHQARGMACYGNRTGIRSISGQGAQYCRSQRHFGDPAIVAALAVVSFMVRCGLLLVRCGCRNSKSAGTKPMLPTRSCKPHEISCARRRKPFFQPIGCESESPCGAPRPRQHRADTGHEIEAQMHDLYCNTQKLEGTLQRHRRQVARGNPKAMEDALEDLSDPSINFSADDKRQLLEVDLVFESVSDEGIDDVSSRLRNMGVEVTDKVSDEMKKPSNFSVLYRSSACRL